MVSILYEKLMFHIEIYNDKNQTIRDFLILQN